MRTSPLFFWNGPDQSLLEERGGAFVGPQRSLRPSKSGPKTTGTTAMKFACPHCQQPLEADDSFAGATVDCPVCGQSFVVETSPLAPEQSATPQPEIPPPPAAAPEQEAAPSDSAPLPPQEPPPPKAAPKFRVVSRPVPPKPQGTVPHQADPAEENAAGGVKPGNSLRNRFNDFTGLEKLEGFSFSDLLSELFKKHKEEDIEDFFTVGTPSSTPSIEQVDTRWPKPWMFFRALAASIGIYLLFDIAWQYFLNNNLLPGMMLMGTIAVPFSALLFFYEVNARRNISLYRVLKLFFLGGIISLILSLILYAIVGDTPKGVWAEAAPGPIEEIGKLFALVWVARSMRYHYKINGLLMGAAVGTGFAVFESLGYALNYLIGGVLLESIGENVGAVGIMKEVIFTRGVLSPLGHIVWTAIAGAALWRVKGKTPFSFSMLGNGKFWHLFLIPVVLHGIWDVSIPYVDDFPYYGKYVLLGVIAWFVVLALIQEGIKELRAEKLSALESRDEG